MPLTDACIQHRVCTASRRTHNGGATPSPLVGEAIFAGTDYPRTWPEFIGQRRATAQLRAACYSARFRRQRMDHVLIASGIAGIGKTALAMLCAADLGTGLIEISGPVEIDDAIPILQAMCDNDVLFWDEIHQAVAGNSAKAGWLVHLLQDGHFVTQAGVEPLPKVTIIAATTDLQRLPTTIIGRFPVKPVLEPYTKVQAEEIAHSVAVKLGFGKLVPYYDDLSVVATASNGNPRDMRALLIALRDVYLAYQHFDLARALDWVGVTRDGLTRLALDYLITLLSMFEGKGDEKSIASALNEPGSLRHTEQLLVQAGYITITPSGREMTKDGVTRTVALLTERGLIEEPA